MKRRFVSLLLAICLMVSLFPAFVSNTEVEAAALSVSSLSCSAYISNATARSYIDKMMKYYITSNSTLQSTLNNGQPVVFMFEGGSDNYWTGSDYANSVWDVRIQAAVFVVKLDGNGNAYVAFCSENCSSIPSYAPNCTAGVGYSGSVTILDGVYRMYRWDHTGPYAAFQLDIPNSNAGGYGLYVPDSVPDGQLLGCSGINVHTRSTTSGSYWSEGCQLIGTGNDSSNEFNAFFKAVTGINANPWLSWNPKNLYTWNGLGYYYGSSYTSGYFVVDRQLGMLGMDGTQYGTGSLNAIYNKTALGKLTSYSTKAAEAAGAFNNDYISANCTYYPSHCEINVTRDQAPVNSYPCSIGTTPDNVTLEYAPAGSTYTVTGMFKNTYGNFWYRVITKGGKTGYIYGGEAYYVRELTSDITLSGAGKPNGHVKGNVFAVSGTISSQYNRLNSAAVWVHSGYGTSGGNVTGGSDTISNNKYVLASSNIDYATAFNELGTGRYTYAISVNYTNYYSEGAATLKENTKTLYLMDEYFMVIPTSVSQSSCAHTYVTTNIGTGGCTSGITVVKTCTTCGYITQTQTTGAHSYGAWTTVPATCTTAGYKVRTCDVCGNQEKEIYAARGHDYSLKIIGATCVSKARYEYTCGTCGDGYSYSGEELAGTWLEAIPEGMDPSLFNTKTQYRYSDIETTTSYSSSLSGYTLKGSSWEQSGTGSVQYVLNWSTGFYTGSSLYSQYNKKSSKVSAYENETTKRVIDSDSITGYLYFHWCAPGSFYSYEHSTGSFTTFHAYYSATSPWNYDCDYNDMSYNTKSTMCGNSTWYFVDEVYSQKYTDYKKLYTHERWGAYSDWSDTAVSATSTRQVQTRTLYQLKDTGFADHSWNGGVITTQPGCTANGVKTFTCLHCNTTKTEVISATGHHYSTVVTPPTCTSAGYTTHTCANCGHQYTDGAINATGHSYGNWVQTVAPSCTQPGVEIRTCSCGDTQSREVAIIDHSYQATVMSPSCTGQGYTAHTCINCGHSYQDNFVDALGHSWMDATCTQTKVCIVCGEKEGDALGHSYQADVTAPDCINGGYTTYICDTCGDQYVSDRTDPLGHSYDAVVSAPTCTSAGYTTYTCNTCGISYQDDHVSALGHHYENVVTAPKCADNGYTTHTCTFCGHSYQDTIVPALGHTMSEATCTAPKTCSKCGATEGAALGHEAYTYSYASGVHSFKCTKCGETVTKAASDSKKFAINSAAPLLSDDIVMKYSTTVPAGFENAYMVFEFNGETFTFTEYEVNASNGRYEFKFPGINPQKMGDNICATLYATVDGVPVSVQIANYSLVKNCDNQLKKSSLDAKTRTMLSDVLMYGEKAQIVTNYNTDVLVTSLLSAASTLTPSTYPDALDSSLDMQKRTGTKDARVQFTGVTLSLGSKMAVRVAVTCTDTSLFTYKVTVSGREYTYTGAELVPVTDGSDGKYYLFFNQMKATEFGNKITFTCWEDDTQISYTIEYSVYTFIYRNMTKVDANTQELLKAIYNYGESTK